MQTIELTEEEAELLVDVINAAIREHERRLDRQGKYKAKEPLRSTLTSEAARLRDILRKFPENVTE